MWRKTLFKKDICFNENILILLHASDVCFVVIACIFILLNKKDEFIYCYDFFSLNGIKCIVLRTESYTLSLFLIHYIL